MGLPFCNITMLCSALDCAWASRSGVSVIALLELLLVQVTPPRRVRAARTHGTEAWSSNSPVSMRAVNSRTTETSTSLMLNVSVSVGMFWVSAVGTESP